MAFTYLSNEPLPKAREEYISALLENGFHGKVERIPAQRSFGRVTASAVYAHINAPHYAASAMDGIAVKAYDTFDATETTPVTFLPAQFHR